MWLEIGLWWLVGSLLIGGWWYKKGRSFWVGFIISILLSPLGGILVTGFMKHNPKKITARQQQKIMQFDKLYAKYLLTGQKYQEASPELKKYLKQLYLISIAETIDLPSMKKSLLNLFEFLTSPQERRTVNILTAAEFLEDHFLSLNLPKEYEAVFLKIAGLYGIDEPRYYTQSEEVLEMIKKLPDSRKD